MGLDSGKTNALWSSVDTIQRENYVVVLWHCSPSYALGIYICTTPSQNPTMHSSLPPFQNTLNIKTHLPNHIRSITSNIQERLGRHLVQVLHPVGTRASVTAQRSYLRDAGRVAEDVHAHVVHVPGYPRGRGLETAVAAAGEGFSTFGWGCGEGGDTYPWLSSWECCTVVTALSQNTIL